MNEQEAAVFMMALAALADDGGQSAEKGIFDDAEPMTATCTVERSD